MKCQNDLKRQESLVVLKAKVKRLLHEKTGYSEDVLERKLEIQRDCLVWTGARNRNGYGMIYIHHTRPWSWKLHRVVWGLVYKKEIPVGMCVLHSCDNPPCCNPIHLRIGTPRENTRDLMERGTFYSVQPRRKLSQEQVQKIRLLKGSSLSQHKIALDFGINQAQISRIWALKAWV